jgi:uncharacterized cupin superfamily protein
MTFRVEKSIARAGETINVPSNAAHQFHNSSKNPARIICICSPSVNDSFFIEVGVPVATRTTPPTELDSMQMYEFLENNKAIAPRYHTELLEPAQ